LRVGIIGCGVFGLAAALELRARGHAVVSFEQDVVPAAKAASNDTSKTIQRLYGKRAVYVELAERAEAQWRRWQDRIGGAFYHPIGHLLVARGFDPGTRLHDSYLALAERSCPPRLLPLAEARELFPQLTYHSDDVVLFDAWGGYAASGQAIADLARLARADGVRISECTPVRGVEEVGSRVRILTDTATPEFERVVVAAGAWLGDLVPDLRKRLRITRQCMAFFIPRDQERHRPGPLPVWAVDAPGDNWYGHPLADGRVKVADNPLGEPADPDSDRDATPGFAERARAFVESWLPGLARGDLVATRSCLYDNTPDADFIVDWAPGTGRVLVAGGGSGHGFKFGGALGPLIADALEDRDNPLGARFRLAKRFGPDA
jgi:glycine/D-amino acid oxidase-like deaminating enzyme